MTPDDILFARIISVFIILIGVVSIVFIVGGMIREFKFDRRCREVQKRLAELDKEYERKKEERKKEYERKMKELEVRENLAKAEREKIKKNM